MASRCSGCKRCLVDATAQQPCGRPAPEVPWVRLVDDVSEMAAASVAR
jgi:hypothetical protein